MPAHSVGASGSDGQKQLSAIVAAQERAASIFRMRHQTKDVSRLAADSGDVFDRTVWIGAGRGLAFGVNVAEQYLPVFSQALEGLRIGIVATLAVLDWHAQELPFFETRRERRVGFFDSQMNRLADKPKPAIAYQRARQQS